MPHTSQSQTTRRPTRRQADFRSESFRAIGLLAALVLVATVAIIGMETFPFSSWSNSVSDTAHISDEASQSQESRVSFVAMGDNLPEAAIGEYADACAGEAGDGRYDFSSLYAPIKPYVEAADLAYMNQETHLGGDSIGPLAWVQGASGNQTLVAYSLGNFLNNHEVPALLNELEGMLSCDFIKEGDAVRIENVSWTPLVNHCETDASAVYALKDYPPELAACHAFFGELDDPIAWLRETNAQIVTGFPSNA